MSYSQWDKYREMVALERLENILVGTYLGMANCQQYVSCGAAMIEQIRHPSRITEEERTFVKNGKAALIETSHSFSMLLGDLKLSVKMCLHVQDKLRSQCVEFFHNANERRPGTDHFVAAQIFGDSSAQVNYAVFHHLVSAADFIAHAWKRISHFERSASLALDQINLLEVEYSMRSVGWSGSNAIALFCHVTEHISGADRPFVEHGWAETTKAPLDVEV